MSKPRRKFDKDFKQEAAKMVLEDGMSKAEAGRRLGVNQNQVANWVKAFEDNGKPPSPETGNRNRRTKS